MDREAYRDLQLLTEISSRDSVTQRRLAKRYRLALGLTNFLMRRLIKKGYIKIVNLERRRLRYLITPKGLAEKARLTYEYLEYSLYFYRQIRDFLSRALMAIPQSGGRSAILYGSGEVAEVAFLTMQQHGIHIVAVIDGDANGRASFMGQSIKRVSDLPSFSFEWAVVARLEDSQHTVQQLCQFGVPEERIIAIPEYVYTPGPSGRFLVDPSNAPVAMVEAQP